MAWVNVNPYPWVVSNVKTSQIGWDLDQKQTQQGGGFKNFKIFSSPDMGFSVADPDMLQNKLKNCNLKF